MNEPPVIDHDDAAHPLLLDQETLAQIEGKEALIKNHHYRAVDFLRRFKRDVLPDLSITIVRIKLGRCSMMVWIARPKPPLQENCTVLVVSGCISSLV